MSQRVRIQLQPLGKVVQVERGARLQDFLFPYGVEFPCGGRGRCTRCRVKLLEGTLPATEEELRILGAAQVEAGWRLACHAVASADATLEIAQWETAILADNSEFAFTPKTGLGVAVDLGTTTLVAQLLDLATGRVLGVRTALNPQVKHGSDVMSRVEYALAGGAAELEGLIREEIGTLVRKLDPQEPVLDIAIVGNTVMHHLFCGISVEPLAHCPFEPERDGLEVFSGEKLGWRVPGNPQVRFLPCLGGFVGSDILAGVLATRMHRATELAALIDLGTNGEIVVGNRERLVCASTAAGPAFEGGRISLGMRAATGAISEVSIREGNLEARVIGHGTPRGICGSGLVDAVAASLELGRIAPSGRLAGGAKSMPVAGPVTLTQADIRELQLAKAATAAGVEIVLERCGARMEDVGKVYLAGAFGNYLNRSSARRIGLVGFSLDVVEPAGNTALLGAKLALFDDGFEAIRSKTEHIPLGSDAAFQEKYVSHMAFPR